jgi:hypothetical protein
MDGTEPLYRLVVFDELDDIKPVRDLFVAATGSHPTDAAQWVARVPGVWPKPLDEATTRKLLDGLYEMEIAAEAWRVDAFPDLGTTRTIHAASCEEAGFRVTGLRSEPTHWVPWDKFELISAGLIEAEDEFRDVSPPSWISGINAGARLFTGRNPARARKTRAMRVPRDPMPEVVLIRKDPRVTFRVVAGQMNYSYLGERLKPSSAENFPLFLADLCARAKSAYLTYPTRDLLAGQACEDDVFPDSQSLLDYSLHRLLWSWYRRDGEARARGETEGD